MKYTTIRIEGAILSADILDKIEQGDIGGQLARDLTFHPIVCANDLIFYYLLYIYINRFFVSDF